MKSFLCILILTTFVCVSECSAQLQFNFNSVNDAGADGGLQLATDAWAAEFKDNIVVNLNFSFANLGSGGLALTSSSTQSNTYVDFWNAIGNDQTSADDTTMWNGLPTGSTFSVYINRTNEATGTDSLTPYVDNDGGANNSNVVLTTANAKALGLRVGTDTLTDAQIVFNSGFAWDFDPTDGIDSGAIDFVSVATHEIGHALGFESGVDELDAVDASNGGIGGIGSGGLPSDNDLAFVSSIDFLRFSNESENAGADIDWTADIRDKYFSIDGGLTTAIGGSSHWSTGVVFGDGQQASHWKDNLGIGILDPTTGAGLGGSITGADVLAFDVIGYDRLNLAVPEPSGLAVALLAISGLAIRRRRRTV